MCLSMAFFFYSFFLIDVGVRIRFIFMVILEGISINYNGN